MAGADVVHATCPHCLAIVEGTGEEFASAIKCPGCGKTAQFRLTITDEEFLSKGAATAAKGMKKAGSFAGRWLKRAASVGAAKYRTHKQHSEAIRVLQTRLLSHLQAERPSLATLAELRGQAGAAGVDLQQEAARLEPSVVPAFFAREMAWLKMGGEATPDLRQALEAYLTAFRPTEAVRADVIRTLAQLGRIQDIRNGRIKPINDVAGLVVRNSEIVWCQCDASLTIRDRSSGPTLHPGRLFITNLRMVFTSRTTPDEFQYGDINAVEVENGRVFVTGKSQRSCAELDLAEPEVVAEHIRYAVRVFHRQVDVGFEGNGGRQIPQEVKLAVWQRDGGKCVQCGATDYLEYDHIIPVAKGGANTAPNVQLLCRRCNLKKSDRI